MKRWYQFTVTFEADDMQEAVSLQSEVVDLITNSGDDRAMVNLVEELDEPPVDWGSWRGED